MAELQNFQKLVIANAQNAKGLHIGEKAPDFILSNAFGEMISLGQSLKKGPVILKFYRGEWCPICNLDLREIQKYLPQFEKLGAQILAVSPQKPDDALTIQQKNNLGFQVLSDIHQKVIKAYKLQFDPGSDYHKRRDLSILNADGSVLLPVPATFIIVPGFSIVSAHVDPNYTERLHPSQMLKVLKECDW